MSSVSFDPLVHPDFLIASIIILSCKQKMSREHKNVLMKNPQFYWKGNYDCVEWNENAGEMKFQIKYN